MKNKFQFECLKTSHSLEDTLSGPPPGVSYPLEVRQLFQKYWKSETSFKFRRSFEPNRFGACSYLLRMPQRFWNYFEIWVCLKWQIRIATSTETLFEACNALTQKSFRRVSSRSKKDDVPQVLSGCAITKLWLKKFMTTTGIRSNISDGLFPEDAAIYVPRRGFHDFETGFRVANLIDYVEILNSRFLRDEVRTIVKQLESRCAHAKLQLGSQGPKAITATNENSKELNRKSKQKTLKRSNRWKDRKLRNRNS